MYQNVILEAMPYRFPCLRQPKHGFFKNLIFGLQAIDVVCCDKTLNFWIDRHHTFKATDARIGSQGRVASQVSIRSSSRGSPLGTLDFTTMRCTRRSNLSKDSMVEDKVNSKRVLESRNT